MENKYSYIVRYNLKAVCDAPLHIGSAEGDSREVLLNPVDNKPFIQASSISGALGSYINKLYGNKIKEEIFGGKNIGKSLIVFSDAEFSKVKLERRPRLKINGKTSTVDAKENRSTYGNKSGQKLELEYVSAGSEFEFTVNLLCDNKSSQKTQAYIRCVEEAFAALNNGGIVFGGQKTNGCGTVKIVNAQKMSFDLYNADDRAAWMNNDYSKKCVNIKLDSIDTKSMSDDYQITLEASAENSVLVKSLSIILDDYDGKLPDAMNITNGKGERVIPGSSVKGVIRSRVEAIAKYKNIDIEKINSIFGREAVKEDNGVAGSIRFSETIIKNKKERAIPRIKIDKFTGGVAASALFSEMPVVGQLKTNICITQSKKFDSKAACGLILFALRDLAIGAISIGGGANIGRGFLNCLKVTVKYKNSEMAVIDFNQNKIIKGNDFIRECLGSIKEMQGGVYNC